jgi:hypothetical protein
MTRTRTRTIWVRLGVAAMAVFLVRLTAATLATAQTTDEEPPPATVPRRVEIGGAAGTTVGIPEYGVLASVPVHTGSALEIIVARMPAFWDAPAHLLAQVQVRMPFREHLRSRKSFLIGVTSIAARRGDEGFLGTDESSYVRPHAGVSLQWPTAPTLDFRLDLQGVFTFEPELPLIPRAMAAFVWHPRTPR